MQEFLRQVAEHYYALGDIDKRCFVLPNRRCALFFKKYLSEAVAKSEKTVFAPGILTISEFLYSLAGASNTDRIQLLITLHECYSRVSGMSEPLDEFIFWGDMILSDFGDVDKYEINPEWIFSNIAEFKRISAGSEFLSETQRKAIEQFVSHFDKPSDAAKNVKSRFRTVWDMLLPLYREFGSELERRGQTYEGRVYRSLSERFSSEAAADIVSERYPGKTFVFAGLNVLCKCEKNILSHLRDASLAEFCWDYSSDWIKDKANKSSMFMRSNVVEFPQAFPIDPEGLSVPEINVVSVPSNAGQAKQLARIFSTLPGGGADIRTAVVLPDSAGLVSVLNSIPEDIADVNVTMGCPMSDSALWALMDDVSAMQMHLREIRGGWYFYHKQLFSILSNPLVRACMTEDEAATAASLKADAKFYIPQSDIPDAEGNLLGVIFRPVVKSVKDRALIADIEDYQQEILLAVAARLQHNEKMLLELDFAREFYLAVNRMKSAQDLQVLPSTYFRLLGGLVGKASVPFHGEPLKGLQIMGPLETRGLDFDNVIILNCNEGVFPHRSASESFIPSELRRGFELPTFEYQDAVWAYYFYRMIQRASKVWMLYDSRAEGIRSGEESRYIKQLELHFGARIKRYVFDAPVSGLSDTESVEKTREHLDKLRLVELSSSSLKDYVSCPLRFYYSKVEGLSKPKEISESMDGAVFGTVFHSVMESIYRPGIVKAERLRTYLKDNTIVEMVRDRILVEQKTIEITGRNLVLQELLVRFCRQVILRDLENMESKGVDHLEVLGVEKDFHPVLFGHRFLGFVDRLDCVEPGVIRVIDYKTGSVKDEEFEVTDENAAKVVGNLFGAKEKDRPKIALQLYLYDRMVSPEYPGKRVINSIYQPARLFREGVGEVALSPVFCELMDEAVERTVKEIFDESVPWTAAKDPDACKYCDFKTLCGR